MTIVLIMAAVGLAIAFGGNAGVVMSTGLLTKGLRSEFFEKYNSVSPIYPQITTEIKSNADKEDYAFLGSVPQMAELGTGLVFGGVRSESYSVKNLEYAAGLEVDRNELNDDQTGQIRIRTGELAIRAAAHKDKMVGSLLENGGTSGFNSYDAVSYFNTTHVSGDSGNQSNAITSGASDTSNPTTAEYKTAIQKATAAIMGFKDDKGEPSALQMSGLLILVPTTHVWTAMEAAQAAIIANTSNVLANMVKVIPFPFLSTQTRFFVLKNDAHIRPFIFQNREAIRFEALEENTETEFIKNKYLYKAQARYRLMYGEWRYAVRCTFS